MKKNSVLSALGQRSEPPAISWLMQIALAKPNLISLAAGFTDNESLPVNEVRTALADILSTPKVGQPALQYGTTSGDPELRALTGKLLKDNDAAALGGKLPDGGKIYGADNLIITGGSQQMLYMVTEALCDEGDVIIMEDPTYFVYLGIAQSRALTCRGVRLEKDGLDPAHLEEVLESLKKSGQIKKLKMLYLVSYFQNPSGVTTSFEKKQKALALLRKYEKFAGHAIYLLEDAAYRDLRFAGADTPSALAIKGATDRVIYAGTYSKPFATGARIGFGILPEPLLTIVTRIKGNHDFGSANLLQQLVKHVIKSGAYDLHLDNLRTRYGCKAKVMVEAIRQHFPKEVAWEVPLGGLYVWAKLPKKLAAGPKSKFFQAVLDNEVLYVPGELCYCADSTRSKPKTEMRLSFGGASEANMRKGIERLGKTIQAALK